MSFQGAVGLPGLQGPPGDYGPVGREGPVGQKGRIGEAGFSGTTGPKGLRVYLIISSYWSYADVFIVKLLHRILCYSLLIWLFY